MRIVRVLFMIVPVLLGSTAVYAMDFAPCASGPMISAPAMNCCGVGCDCSVETPTVPMDALPGATQSQTPFSLHASHELSTVRSLDVLDTSDPIHPSAEAEESPHQSSSVRLYDLISDYRK